MKNILIAFFLLLYMFLVSVGYFFEAKYNNRSENTNDYWKVNEELELKDALIKFTDQNQNSAYQVKYFSNRIISLKVDYLHRTPNTYKNIDMKTGKEIHLRDVFKCKRYKDMLSNYIVRNYGDRISTDIIIDDKYFFTEDGLVIVVGDQELNKYTIPKDIVGKNFKSREKGKCFKKFFKLNGN
ncbi:MAG: hypothetical protein N4A76_17045 [Firmicutes bacterium]|jgi:hypothetical protein|nr:hypothetical protein [Bacillota bacterium]